MPHKVGDIGRYRLIAELARGGMGIVFLALVRGPGGFNKLFVVKLLKAHLAEDPKLVTMFLEEARLAAKLNHPNVVQTIEVGSDDGRHYIAMEFLDGQSLHRLQARGRRTGTTLPLAYHLFIFVQLLEGLHYAHTASDFDGTALNLVHRDVSPQNVLVTYEGQVKILDFGIAKALDSSNDTRTGTLKGKVAYMAPEQGAGEAVDARTDLFAVGVMLWEAAVGQRMWSRALNDLQILHALMSGKIPEVRAALPGVDARLERIITKATSIKPADRYQTAAEMQKDLEAYLKDLAASPFGSRDIGKFVSDVFVQERAQMKAVIDDQVRLLRGTASGDYGTIDLPRLAPLNLPSGTPSEVMMAAGGRESREGSAAAMYVPALPPTGVPAVAAPSSRGPLVAVLVVGGLLAVAGVAALLFRGSPTTQAASTPSAVAVSAPTGLPTVVPPPSTEPTQVAAASAAPERSSEQAGASPSVRTYGGYPRPVGRPQPTGAPAPTDTSAVLPPPVPQPSAAAPPQPTEKAHIRQEIDTSNPYGH